VGEGCAAEQKRVGLLGGIGDRAVLLSLQAIKNDSKICLLQSAITTMKTGTDYSLQSPWKGVFD
jgi:hypothetical protein